MKKINKIIEFIKIHKSYIIFIAIIVLSIASIIIQYVDKTNNMQVNSNKIESKEEKIAVYINGAVKNPGVYYLPENSRLYELLDACGGILENADIQKVNLARKLVDSDMITIYEEKLEKDIEGSEFNDNENYEDDLSVEKEKININQASKSELMTLNGIGEQTANKIIEYRNNIKFNEIEDIMNVSGIGESKYESIKEYICVY